VIFHPHDRVIRYRAQFISAIHQSRPTRLKRLVVIKMQDAPRVRPQRADLVELFKEAHCRDFRTLEWEQLATFYQEARAEDELLAESESFTR
jgi:hypothetical protein